MSKLENFEWGQNGAHFEMLRVTSSSVKAFEFFFHGIDAHVKSSCCEHILANI